MYGLYTHAYTQDEEGMEGLVLHERLLPSNGKCKVWIPEEVPNKISPPQSGYVFLIAWVTERLPRIPGSQAIRMQVVASVCCWVVYRMVTPALFFRAHLRYGEATMSGSLKL